MLSLPILGADEGTRTPTSFGHGYLKPGRLPIPPHPHSSINVFTLLIPAEKIMVLPDGFEPPTLGSSIRCSTT